MKLTSSLLARFCLIAPLALAACTTTPPDPGVTSRLSAPYVEIQHQYRFASGAGSLSGAERSAIHGFLAQQALREGDVVIATIPSAGDPRIDAARRQSMQAALSRVPGRVRLAQDAAFGGRPTPRSQQGILRVARARGIQVTCAEGFGDLGCANATNLATMIHEPGDVLTPAVTGRRAGN